MSERPTLPGDIPGLLRRYSPVLIGGEAQAVRGLEYASDETLYLRLFGWGRPFHSAEAVLDLTDATGRAHAAWWVRERFNPTCSIQEEDALSLAETALDLNAFQIATLRSLILRLAGRKD